ncbi:glycoside hydrolase family 20 zincin-like fold domain-containing protein, partial [Flavitalea sp.]|nr:family 20 glycosylhydrolase [Flavitalea sp.]
QAYRLQLEKGRITITANAGPGLFYGVQTLIQLLQPGNGKAWFSGGRITDWPDMDLRMIYWDDAHHLERLDAMKRAILQASYYKINAFTLKLEGHFQFTGAKPIVEPYAYTPAEFQELTDYAKAHYVELVPYIDAPAHISFILKHPEYKSLRAFPNSNYDLSVVDPKADELLLGMVDELINANKGGKYFFLSTDEAYYVGKSDRDKSRAAALGGNGRLLAEYITRISNKIHEKGRKVIIWGEYPLLPEDVTFLPSHLINGINGNSKDYGSRFKEHGIRHLVFTSAQGVEPLFPNYYRLPKKSAGTGSLPLTDDELQQGEMAKGRVSEVINTITTQIEAGKSDFMGVIVCGWADAGSNPETFWLGYATGNAAAWNINAVNPQDLTNRFYNSFYGANAILMDKVYQLLSTQAEFWEKSWDWAQSNNRTPIVGYSAAIFDTPRPAKDQVLPLLPLPSATDLSFNSDWNNTNKERLQLAEKFLKENNELMLLLQKNLNTVQYQQYHLQVLYSVAKLCRQNLEMLLDLKKINELLRLSAATASGNPVVAVSLIDHALELAGKINKERNETLNSLTAIWYQDWLPRVAEANGRKYVDQVDDVKDHPPVRTVDMTYLIYRQLHYPLVKWAQDLLAARNGFAKKNNLSERTDINN